MEGEKRRGMTRRDGKNMMTVLGSRSSGDCARSSRVQRRRRHPIPASLVGVCALFLLAVGTGQTAIFMFVLGDAFAGDSRDRYEWEGFDCYQILGFFLPEGADNADGTVASGEGGVGGSVGGGVATHRRSAKGREGGSLEGKSRRKRLSERSRIRTSDVRKAYRKQAQLWHPDKVAGKLQAKKHEEDVGELEAMVAESTVRFERIAAAYEMLSDEEKREEYDMHLLDEEDRLMVERRREAKILKKAATHGGGAVSIGSGLRSFFEQFSTDPFALFEEFFFEGVGGGDRDLFFGGGGGGEDGVFADGDHFDKPLHRKGGHRGGTIHGTPSRVSERTESRYDPGREREVYRVLHREEYDPLDPRDDRVYYQIMGQEFVEEDDGSFSHVSDRYLVEEGYLADEEEAHENRHQGERQLERRHPILRPSSYLGATDVLTPDSAHLCSLNGLYYAGLTPDCELIILHAQGESSRGGGTEEVTPNSTPEEKLIWTSDTFLPAGNASVRCALALYGGQLAVVVGDPDDPVQALWVGPEPPPVTPDRERDATTLEVERDFEYRASLDDDGGLRVYRRYTPQCNNGHSGAPACANSI